MHLKRTTPEEQGSSSAGISRFVQALEEQEPGVISMMLLRHGSVIAEFCKYPYRPEGLRLLFSMTKSVTGIGIGIACDKGLLSLEDRVLSFFPDFSPSMISENLSHMTVRDLLTMSCGIGENTYAQLITGKEWIRAFLNQSFVHAPGTYYEYCTHASYMLSAITETMTGDSFYTFIKQNLLEPLQIHESSWEKSPEGITAGGMGLGLTTEGIAKFGQMLLCGGRYGGRQIVSEEFVRQAAAPQIEKGTVKPGARSSRYGYQIHIDSEEGCFFADGAFGQLCYVAPRQDTVLVITSQKSDVNRIIELLWQHILNTVSNTALSPSGESETLAIRLKNLCFPVLEVNGKIPDPSINGTYRLTDNPAGLEQISLRYIDNELKARFEYVNHPGSIFAFRFDRAVYATDTFIKDIEYHQQNCALFASWKDNTLFLTVYYIETPYVTSYEILFTDNRIRFAFSINVSFTLNDFTCDGRILS